MAKMPTHPTVLPTGTPSRARKISKGIGSGFRAVGSALVVIAEAEATRQREVREIDDQIRELEMLRAVRTGGHLRLQRGWSLTHTGHLITCPDDCTWRHCIDCGDRVTSSSSIRCWTCN